MHITLMLKVLVAFLAVLLVGLQFAGMPHSRSSFGDRLRYVWQHRTQLGILASDYVLPEEITAFIRAVPWPSTYTLNRFLPDVEHQAIEVALDSIIKTNRAAKFRAYDAETPIGKRNTFNRNRVTLPPIGEKRILGEYERLKLEGLRNQNANGAIGALVADNIFNDSEQNVQAIRARVELARGQVLSTGKFTLTNENGLTLEADFGVPGGHFVAPGTLWSTIATATPLADIRAWVRTYLQDTGGQRPAAMILSYRILSYLLQNAEIRALAAVNPANVPNIVTEPQLNQVFAAHGLPPVEVYDTAVDVDGTVTRAIADNKVIFVPEVSPSGTGGSPNGLGQTAWGITAESLEMIEEARIELTDAPGVIGIAWAEEDPVQLWTKATAVVMPAIGDPMKLMVATVAA